jgi:hypothetical protein
MDRLLTEHENCGDFKRRAELKKELLPYLMAAKDCGWHKEAGVTWSQFCMDCWGLSWSTFGSVKQRRWIGDPVMGFFASLFGDRIFEEPIEEIAERDMARNLC